MAITTIAELIAKREALAAKRQRTYELETSIGTILCKPPEAILVSEAEKIDGAVESNAYLVYNCVIEPNLRDAELQKAYNVFEPNEIVGAIFQAGEISRIAGKLLDLAGYRGKIAAKLHEQVKNS